MSDASQRLGINATLRDQVKRSRDEQDESRKRDLLRQARETAKRKTDYASEDELDQEAMREALNFSEWCESLTKPLYEVKGDLPKCPPGYRYSKEQKQCVPKTEKDDVRVNKGGSKDSEPRNAPGYNVWGRTGVNGDGYAWAEPNNWDTDAYEGPSGGAYN
jgi:hypothetical protein